MAFNPFVTFQKNRRFWMAAILMICMVSFVFCTGIKGDMADRILVFFGRGGSTAFTIDGRTYTTAQVHQLKDQRNLADKLMKNVADMAFKKLNKLIFELDQPNDAAKPEERKVRMQQSAQLKEIRKQIGYRKARTRYFDIGIKFDDLVEFAMWQAMADKMGIYLDDSHVTYLYFAEFFVEQARYLEIYELDRAEQITRQEFRDVTHGYVRKAITEEFRVRIAQEAYLMSQPFAYYMPRRQEGPSPRLLNPEIPEQVRAPLTPAQIWDLYKKNRSEFNVTLLPVHVQDYLKLVKEMPSEDDRAKFYKAAKDRPVDPTSDVAGLQLPARVKLKYVYADASSPAYLDAAKLIANLRVISPMAPDAAFSPLAVACRYAALDKAHRLDIEKQYDDITRFTDKFDYRTSAPGAGDFTTPLLMWFARREWEAAATLVAPTPATPFNALGAVAGYMAWGAHKHPEELKHALEAESKRRAPYVASLVGTAIADPLTTIGADFGSNFVVGFNGELIRRYQPLPVEAAFKELEERSYHRAAEEKAQENMQIARTALDKAEGDAEKMKRELNRLVPELKLTIMPPADKEDNYYNRYTISEAKELEPLKDAYLRYIDAINMFEARDLTPERLLKPGDFYKIFFDSSESFSASAMNRAMPWPPIVTRPNNQRIFGIENPRLIDPTKVAPALQQQFNEFVGQNNPLAPLPSFDGLFKNADKPMLFWRTAKRDPKSLPSEYAKLADELKSTDQNWHEVEKHIQAQLAVLKEIEPVKAEIKKAKNDPKAADAAKKRLLPLNDKLKRLENEASGTVSTLREKQADLKEYEADLKEVQRLVVDGWKFEQARKKNALPVAESVADALLKGSDLVKQAQKLDAKLVTVNHLSPMHPENMGEVRDYAKTPLPKDLLTYPRDDTIDQSLSLYDLKEPIKIGNKELDDINQKLFDLNRKTQNPRGNYVQILTNKPRSTFYVAKIELPPEANQKDFIKTMKVASLVQEQREREARMKDFPYVMDRFVERVQQQDAKNYRASVVEGLKKSMGYDDTEATKFRRDFDEKVHD